MNYKYLADFYTSENEFQRDKMQFFFDKSFREKDELLLRNQYKALRLFQFDTGFDFTPETIHISSLAESLTTACDVLATGTGMNFIYCGESDCHCIGDEGLITKCLLNLLSNAYLYGRENLITAKCVRMKDFIKIEILNGGAFSEDTADGKGLSYVRKATSKMNGRFLIEQSLSHTKAVILLRSSIKPTHKNYDFLDFVNDRLSPVCVELFGMEYK